MRLRRVRIDWCRCFPARGLQSDSVPMGHLGQEERSLVWDCPTHPKRAALSLENEPLELGRGSYLDPLLVDRCPHSGPALLRFDGYELCIDRLRRPNDDEHELASPQRGGARTGWVIRQESLHEIQRGSHGGN